MPAPISDDQRQQIIELCQQGKARNDIAREVGVSQGTVSKVAKAIDHRFDRSKTKTACEARQADNAARRAELQAALVEDAHRLRAQLWTPCVERKPLVVSDGVKVGAHVEVVEVEWDEPPFADKQRIMTAVGIAVDKVLAVDRHDNRNDEGLAAVDQWLRNIVGG